MDEWKTRYYEILASLEVCRQKNFSRASVQDAVLLIKSFYEEAPNRSDAEKLANVAKMLADKMEERERLEREWRERGSDVRYAHLFPAVPPEEVVALPIGNVNVLEANKIYRDNTQILVGPFESELIVQTKFFAKQNDAAYRLVDCAQIARDLAADAEGVFQALGAFIGSSWSQEIVVYSGAAQLCQNASLAVAFCKFLRTNRQNKSNVRQFILCVGHPDTIGQVYSEHICTGHEESEEIADSPLPVLYLPLPLYSTVKNHIFRKYPDAGLWEAGILRRSGYLLGFEGLCELLASEEGDWLAQLEAIAEPKKQLFDAFAQAISFNLELVLDKEWDYRIEEAPPIEISPDDPVRNPVFRVPATLYDSVDELETIRRNIVKIVELDKPSIRVRCAWIVTYALTNGDILNVLNVDEAELEAVLKGRWTIAYAALTQLMRIPFGELVFDIEEGEGFLGLCCDGGRTIRMSKAYIHTRDRKKLGAGCNTMLHELFHALQHAGIRAREGQDVDLLSYYLTYFNVSGHRISAWAENNQRYHSPEDGFEMYLDQTMEADARTFAGELLSEFGQMHIPEID